MSNRRPYLLLHTKDILSDKRFVLLTLEEKGVLFTLFCWENSEEFLPKNLEKLATLVSMTEHKFSKKFWPKINSFFVSPDGFPERLVRPENAKSRFNHEEFLAKQKANGSLGGRPKKNPNQNPNQNPNHNPSETQTITQTKPYARHASYQIPDISNNQSTSLQLHTREAWTDFLENYPDRNTELDAARSEKIFETLAADGVNLEIVVSQVKAYRRFCDSEGNTGTKFVKQMSGWLNEGYWTKNWETKADQRESEKPEKETYRELTDKDIEDIHR